MIKNFKDKAMQLRRGEWLFDKKKILLINSTIYAGSQISNAVISYLIMTIILTLVFTILVWPLFWLLLKDMILTILLIILPTLIKPILNAIATMVMVTNNSIRLRR